MKALYRVREATKDTAIHKDFTDYNIAKIHIKERINSLQDLLGEKIVIIHQTEPDAWRIHSPNEDLYIKFSIETIRASWIIHTVEPALNPIRKYIEDKTPYKAINEILAERINQASEAIYIHTGQTLKPDLTEQIVTKLYAREDMRLILTITAERLG